MFFSFICAVKQKYNENVPHDMTEKEFWTRFFQSHYFHRDRINTGTQDIFSECAKQDEKGKYCAVFFRCERAIQKHRCLFIFVFFFVRLHFPAGLKSMVVQGVKNPLVDLLALDDKTLDEVFLTRKQPYSRYSLSHAHFLSPPQGYGVCTPLPSTSSSSTKTVKESSNSAIVKRFNHHSAMVLAAGSRKG